VQAAQIAVTPISLMTQGRVTRLLIRLDVH
jgi:hypothetical protein